MKPECRLRFNLKADPLIIVGLSNNCNEGRGNISAL